MKYYDGICKHGELLDKRCEECEEEDFLDRMREWGKKEGGAHSISMVTLNRLLDIIERLKR